MATASADISAKIVVPKPSSFEVSDAGVRRSARPASAEIVRRARRSAPPSARWCGDALHLGRVHRPVGGAQQVLERPRRGAGTAPRRRSPSARDHRSAGPRRWRWRSSPPARGRRGRRRCRASARRTRRRPSARRGRTRARRCASRSAAATSARSPASWPTVSLTTLNWSRSMTIRQAVPPSRPSRASVSVARRSNSARFGRPVSASVVARRCSDAVLGEHPAEGERPRARRRPPAGRRPASAPRS